MHFSPKNVNCQEKSYTCVEHNIQQSLHTKSDTFQTEVTIRGYNAKLGSLDKFKTKIIFRMKREIIVVLNQYHKHSHVLSFTIQSSSFTSPPHALLTLKTFFLIHFLYLHPLKYKIRSKFFRG